MRPWRSLYATAISALIAGGFPVPALGSAPCPLGVLPAYAHNDYENPRPLEGALDSHFRGVEADLFLVDGILRLGHDLRSARRGKAFETVYLRPLSVLVARCGQLTADGQPFLLAVELKEPSQPAYANLVMLLRRYSHMLTPLRGPGTNPPVEVVLVGWHPPVASLRAAEDDLIRIQHRVTRPDSVPVPFSGEWVRLSSVDYGKTMRRSWTSISGRRRWLAALREVKRLAPTRLLRVHNLPAHGDVYDALLGAGVDLIGTRDLATTSRLLAKHATRVRR